MRRLATAALVLTLGACGRPGEAPPAPAAPAPVAAAEPAPRELRRCFATRPAWDDAPVTDLLERAGKLLDGGDAATALACAEEAARQAPRSVEAHEDRAAALADLER